jgi:hypothetical protein
MKREIISSATISAMWEDLQAVIKGKNVSAALKNFP